MPNPMDFENQEDFMKVCVPMRLKEGDSQEQAVGACMGMWAHKDDAPAEGGAAVKAIGDWELDVLAIPFNKVDADGQWFDENTEIKADNFNNPLIAYQHGIAQGAKGMQANPVFIGSVKPGSLEKKADGWHIRVILDKASKLAKAVWEAAKAGIAAVSSGSIAHLARLDINGKLIPYEKDRKGRIGVWPLAEVSLWEKANGNFNPASHFALALPVFKAIYREAGKPFPEIKSTQTHGDLPEAQRAARRSELERLEKQLIILQNDLHKHLENTR